MSDNAQRIVTPASGGPTTGLFGGLLRSGSIADFRAAAPLPLDAQILIDNAVVRVGLERLVVAADIISAGLTYSLPNWLAVPNLYWEQVAEVGGAKRVMNPSARGDDQGSQRAGKYLPVYATMDDFSIGIRQLLASERAGAPLDTSGVEQAVRRVNEAIEDAAINGPGLVVAGNTAYGLLTAPNAATQAYVDNEAWTAAGHSGDDILTDVLAMITKLVANKRYGPYNLYVPTTYYLKLMNDFKSATSGTILERLQAIQAGGRNLVVKSADMLAAPNTVLVQMTSDVLDMVQGQDPTVVSWESPSGWERYFAVLACQVPRIKDDFDSKSGICIGSTT